MSRLTRRLRYLFQPRGPVYVSPRKIIKAAALLTVPAFTGLLILWMYGYVTLSFALTLVVAMYFIHIPLIWPYLTNLSALTHYVQHLAANRKSTPPDLTFLNNMEELTTAVQALQQSWEKRQNLLEAMVSESKILIDTLPDALLLLDQERRLLRINAAARLLFSDGGASLLEEPQIKAALQEVALQHRGRDLEYTHELQGRDYLVRIEKFPTYSPGGITFIVVLHDITEMKRTEQMFSDFVANASHEIRTPLASMMGFIETLQGPAKDDANARTEFLGIMSEQAARMANLVKDLLSLSEIEKNVTTRPNTVVSLSDIAEEVIRLSSYAAKERGMQVEKKIVGAVPEIVGDKNELFRVLTNLITNAVKYGNEGSVIHVEVGVAKRIPPQAAHLEMRKAVYVSVQDEGEGIAPEHLPRLTERFYRVDKARSRAVGGTGLGLAIVRRILDRHGGLMTIESQLGKGSIFTIYLPG